MGELPLEKLTIIEQYFDIDGIRILDKDRAKFRRSNQGESTPLNLKTYKKIRDLVDRIIKNIYIDKKAIKMVADLQLATQIIDIIAHITKNDEEASKYKLGSEELEKVSGMVGLLTGKTVCIGDSIILENVLSCVNIECISIEGIATINGKDANHAWNIVKLGEKWFEVDLTFARPAILEGEDSGDLFMSDQVFFGDRRWCTFEKGRVVNGKRVEKTVKIGGHSKKIFTSNHKPCENYISPYITTCFMQRFRKYRNDGPSSDNEGVVPYVGSSLEEKRSTEKSLITKLP